MTVSHGGSDSLSTETKRVLFGVSSQSRMCSHRGSDNSPLVCPPPPPGASPTPSPSSGGRSAVPPEAGASGQACPCPPSGRRALPRRSGLLWGGWSTLLTGSGSECRPASWERFLLEPPPEIPRTPQWRRQRTGRGARAGTRRGRVACFPVAALPGGRPHTTRGAPRVGLGVGFGVALFLGCL